MSDSIGNTLGSLATTAFNILTNSPLKLGSVSFSGMEIPEFIEFGGDQQLSRKTLIGGKRSIESLGPSEIDPIWTGRFQGSQAFSRATAVDALRKAGKPVTFTYGGMSYTALIKRFVARYEHFWQIPYSITLEIVSVGTGNGGGFLNKTISDVVGADVLGATGLGKVIGDTTLSGALSAAQTGLATVGALTGSKAIASIGGTLSAVSGVANIISNAGNVSLSSVVFGVTGALSNIGVKVSALTNAASAASRLANSVAVQNLVTRAIQNLGS